MSEQSKSPEHVRSGLIDTAMSLILERGDLSFSLRQLAEAAETSTMSIYTHFGNREGLHRALASRAFDLFAAGVDAATESVAGGDVLEKLTAIADAYRQFARSHPSAFDLIFGGSVDFSSVLPLRTDFDGLPSLSENGQVVYGFILSVIEEGVRDGRFSREVDPWLVMDTYWAQVHGLVALERLGYVRDSASADERFRFGLRSILAGLQQPIQESGD